MKKILGSGWFLPLLLTAAVWSATVLQSPLLQLPEVRLFDHLSALRPPATAPVTLVEIDDESLSRLGPWPWPRTRLANLLEQLAAAEVKAIALHPALQGREINPGLAAIQEVFAAIEGEAPETAAVRNYLEKVVGAADGNRRLTEALQSAGNVVLCLDYRPGTDAGRDRRPHPPRLQEATRLPPAVRREAAWGGLPVPRPLRSAPAPAAAAGIVPPAEVMGAAAGLAHNRLFPDRDGVVRHLPLALEVDGRALPALPLALAAAWSGESIDWRREQDGTTGVRLGGRVLPTDTGFRLLSAFDPRGLERLGAARLLAGEVAPERLRGRAVVIGVTAEGGARRDLPRRQAVPEAEIAALAAAGILADSPLSRPAWAFPLESAVLLYLAFFLLVVLPRIPARIGLLLLAGFLVTWWGVAALLLVRQGLWLHLVPAAALAVPGFFLLQLRRALSPRLAESTELNKMLGLSFQGQGMLDLALEKFSRCPAADPSVRELLYNLGLDFERKRMHNKASSVYRRLLKGGRFRDVQERIARLEALEGTVVLGAGRSGPLRVDGSAARPTLGRYEIVRELGQGAMGTVYLGRDPRINREVAIKTMRYGDLEEGELAEVKERFFREAEAAGKLSHPQIVTIYDAGEEHDLAFLAMEVLAGRSLEGNCRKEGLLPLKQVLEIVAQVADALDYAHRQGVVHRDIKPANLMLLDSGSIKVTDFGIARILCASSATRTGTVLGTPSYMSPEQVAGRKVDGRSDLFSLGAVFYELLAGVKPFQGESIATLMYNITNVSHKPLSRAAKVPAGCSRIVEKLLAKELTRRYRTGAEVAADLRRCLQRLG